MFVCLKAGGFREPGHVLANEPEEVPPFVEWPPPPETTSSHRWKKREIEELSLAVNCYRDALRAKFVGSSGGRERRYQGWISVRGK